MFISLEETKKNAELFKLILKPVLTDPTIEAWQLAIALDWAKQQKISCLWFKEDEYVTHNGLSLVDGSGAVLYQDICGFVDKDERLLQEAFAVHALMHENPNVEYFEFD